jgi:hypothetical protein
MKKLDEDISSLVALVQGAWFQEKSYKDKKIHEVQRVQAFLGAVDAARKGRLEELYDYLRPVLNEIRLHLEEDGKPAVMPINAGLREKLDKIMSFELQWAYAAFRCLNKIKWEELKNCKTCGRPFYGGGKKRLYCGQRCMLKVNIYKPERDRMRSKVRNFIHRLQKKGSRVEPLLAAYLKKRNMEISCLPDKWQKALKKWEDNKARGVKRGRD